MFTLLPSFRKCVVLKHLLCSQISKSIANAKNNVVEMYRNRLLFSCNVLVSSE